MSIYLGLGLQLGKKTSGGGGGGAPPLTNNVGYDAILYGSLSGEGRTWIILDNPANGDGIIDTVKIRATGSNIFDGKVGSFYESSPGEYTLRDSKTGINAFTSGVTNVATTLDFREGDFIGIWTNNGQVSTLNSGGNVAFAVGDAFAGPVSWNSSNKTIALQGIPTV